METFNYYTVVQAAAILGMDRQYIWKLVKRGRFPGAIRQGHDWLIPKQEVDTFQRGTPGRPKQNA